MPQEQTAQPQPQAIQPQSLQLNFAVDKEKKLIFMAAQSNGFQLVVPFTDQDAMSVATLLMNQVQELNRPDPPSPKPVMAVPTSPTPIEGETRLATDAELVGSRD